MRFWIGIALALAGVVGSVWWRLARRPPDRGAHVSSTWLDEQARGHE